MLALINIYQFLLCCLYRTDAGKKHRQHSGKGNFNKNYSRKLLNLRVVSLETKKCLDIAFFLSISHESDDVSTTSSDIVLLDRDAEI